jgi:hypothetical protein
MPERSDLLEALIALSDPEDERIESIADELQRIHEGRHAAASLGMAPSQSTTRRLRALLFEGLRSEVVHHQDRLRRARAFSRIAEDATRSRVRDALARKVDLEKAAAPEERVELSFVVDNKGALRERVTLTPIELRGTTTATARELETEYHVEGKVLTAAPGEESPELVLAPSSWTPLLVSFHAPEVAGFYMGRLVIESTPQTTLWLRLTVSER